MDFALATASNEPQLRRLLRTQPMPGWVRLTYEREPNFFHAATTQGDNQVIVARQGGEIVGMGCRSWREVYLNGQPARIGYLSGLRLQESARNSTGMARGYAFLKRLHADGKVPGYLSTIIESNDEALRLLTSRRAGLPVYQDLGRFFSFARPIGHHWRATRPHCDLPVEQATPANFHEILDFLNEQGRRRQFFPVVRAADFNLSLWRGLAPEHFLVGRNPDRSIAGVLGCWDQSAFKQTRVLDYAPGISRFRWVCNTGLQLAGLARLPEPGEVLKLLHLALISIRDDRMDTFATLLNAAGERWQNAGFSHICCGFHECDPLIAAMRGWATLRYASRLYWVYWEDEAMAPIRFDSSRIPHLEVATL